MDQDTLSLGLWSAVAASGIYHGLNPGMGWPLAVSAALLERRSGALVATLGWLAIGHAIAMLVVLLPFALLAGIMQWMQAIAIGAALLVIAFGLYRLVVRRHPRGLARIPPSQVAMWSFAVATAHGAGLMLVPVYLGLCSARDLEAMGLGIAAIGIAGNLILAFAVSATHTLAMIAAGGLMAWAAFRYVGLGLIKRSWLDLDQAWAASLVLVGAASLATALN